MTNEKYLDALLALPYIDDDLLPKVSPDGKWVAWTWFQVGPAADVFAAPTDGTVSPIRLTNTAESTYLISWTPDSRAVLVVQDEDGNERDQIFRIDLDQPLKMVPLTEPKPNYYIQGGQLHPNGKWLVYAMNFDVAIGQEIEETWVYRHDLGTGERVPLAKAQKAVRMTPKLNRQGTHLLYNRKDLHPAGYQTWIVDIDGKNDRELLNFGDNVRTSASWHPDGEQILVIVDTPTHRRLGLSDRHNSEIRWLLDDPTRDIEAAYTPYGSEKIVVVENLQGRLMGRLLDPESGTEQQLPKIPGNLIPIAPISPMQWIGFYYSAQHPGEVVCYETGSVASGRLSSITRVWERTLLSADSLYPAQDFTWQSVDGLPVHGWLYRTSATLSTGGKAKGTIIYVHGGPTYHSRDMLNPQIQFFVRQGFNVLDPNYRGSTGYGMAFREAIIEDGWGGREQEDIRTGIEALIEAGIAEGGRIGITGTSYGGYSSWWAITHLPTQLIAAAAPICGMTDLVVDYETTRPDIRPYSEEMMGGNPLDVPERYFERSPIHFIENIRGKLLIIQGAQDPNVTPKNVDDVVIALKEANVPYEELIFEDEGHGISKTTNQRQLLLRLADFFEAAFQA